MLSSQYIQNEKQKHFFLLPNALFDIELHVYALAIYAYLIRIEDRNTYQCIVSYSTIANKLGMESLIYAINAAIYEIIGDFLRE